jgi:hypothetical protein
MRIAYLLLLGLICVSPVLLFVDGPRVQALVVAYAAVAVGIVGVFIRAGEAEHLAKVIRPVAIISTILILLPLIQLMPLPIKNWVHPIWSDAETALGSPIVGSISIDPGATLVAICRYSSAAAILFTATAVSIDRMRAERILLWLVGASVVCAVLQILHGAGLFPFIDGATNAGFSASTTALASLGLIMASAALVRVIERGYETLRIKSDRPLSNLIGMSPSLAACGICGLSLVIFASAPIGISAATGLVTFVILMIVRRLGFGVWTGNTIAAVTIGIAVIIAIVASESHAASDDLVLRYASHSRSPLVSMTQRIIGDTGWAGSGAGTFELLLPIYGESNTGTGTPAPSAAAKITVELGRPILWAILITAIVTLFLLIEGSLQRGRDSFYPAAGAGCVVILSLEAFCDASLFSTTVLIYAMVALGLALSQRVSRTISG